MTTHHHDHLTRRSLVAGAGGLVLLAAAGPAAAGPAPLGPRRIPGAERASALTDGTTLVFADLHNHTKMSDGSGDPDKAFASMRSAGLDVAALTDHAALRSEQTLTPSRWDRAGKLADDADDPGKFTAIRGFEWSHHLLGHINIWFSKEFTAPTATTGLDTLYRWIEENGGLSSFNHPGRERGRFDNFRYVAGVADTMVALEMFNQREDFLFDGWPEGHSSPMNACLNAGWRTGLSGVTDEHGDDWGQTAGKGRTGLWVTHNTRAGVLAAMRARRFYATRVDGLRVDAQANGVRMGKSLPIAKGDVTFAVDVDRGNIWRGKKLTLQLLRPGTRAPEVVEVVDAVCGTTTEFTVPLDVADGEWMVLRVSDPAEPSGTPGPAGHACNDFAVAYASPWWLGAPAKSSSRLRHGR